MCYILTDATFPLFFFNDTATTEIYTLSLHDALPISGTDSHQTVVRLNDVAIAGKNESALGIGNDQQGFQVAKSAILTPFLRQFNRGFLQIPGNLLQLAFEAFKKCNRVGGGAGETSYDLVIV